MTHDASVGPAVGYKMPPVESRFKKGARETLLDVPGLSIITGPFWASIMIKTFQARRKRARRQSNEEGTG